MLSRLAPYINSHLPVPIDLMIEAFNTAGHARDDSDYRHAAGEIMSEAGVYLHPIELSWFISARGTDDEALEAIRHRKAYITRAASLIPALLSFFDVKDSGSLESVLRQIDDFCRDFAAIKATPHEKRVRKEIASGLQRVLRAVTDLVVRLDEFGHHIDIEFNHHKTAIARTPEVDRFGDSFEPFRADLKRLSVVAEIVLYRERIGGNGFIVTDNRPKFRAVECIYQISLSQNAPAFVTTPGSDFATACSLLYEIASGEYDVGLAGAINRFAKSSSRKEIFEEEQSFRWDNSDEGMRAYETDNFAAVKERTAKLKNECTFWEEIVESRDWDVFSRRELLERRADVLEKLQRTLLENGPHLVWGSQMMRAYGPAFDDLEEMHNRLVKAEIALGKSRRLGRNV